MQKFDVQIALEGVAEASQKWSAANRQFQAEREKVLSRLIHEAAINYMSPREFARVAGLTLAQVKRLMQRNGLHISNSKRLLSEAAAKALAGNAELLGVKPHEIDLTSPLAYLPAGSMLRQQITDATTAQVKEFPETEQGPEPAISLLRDISASEQVPTWMRAEADQVLDRVYGVQT